MADFSESEIVALTLVYTIITIVGACGNFIVLTSICWRKSARKVLGNIFIVNLALADFLSCTLCGPYYIRSLHVNEFFKVKSNRSWLCTAILLAAYLLSIESIMSLTLLSLDRFLAVRLPFWYHKNVTRNICLVSTLGSWVYSIAAVSPAMIFTNWISYENQSGSPCGFQWTKANSSYIILAVIFSFVLPAITVSVTNCYVFRTARDQNRKVHAVRKVTVELNGVNMNKTTGLAADGPLPNKRPRSAEGGEGTQRRVKANQFPVSFADDRGNNCLNENRNSSRLPKREDRKISSVCSRRNYRIQLQGRCSQERLLVAPKPLAKRNNSVDDVSTLEPFTNDTPNKNGSNFKSQSYRLSFSESNLQKLATRHSNAPADLFLGQKPSRAQGQSLKWKRASLAKIEMRLALSTLAIALCFFVTWLPFVVTRVMRSALGFNVSNKVVNGFSVFALMSSLCNPYVVLFSRRNIFVGFKSMLKKSRKYICK